MTLRLTVAEALARVLASAGVPGVYGIPGGKMTPLLKALTLPFVPVRHEGAAALMATAAGMLAPVPFVVPSVALAEQAPGIVNLASGLGTAFANSLPVLALTVSVPQAVAGRGAMMELEAGALLRPLVKASFQLTEPRRAVEMLRRALREAVSGPPGPVHLDVPADVLAELAAFDPAGLEAPMPQVPRPAPDPVAVQRAVDLLRRARRPVLVFGGGAVGAAGAAQALAERLGAPVLVSQMGLGVVPSDHPLLVGQGGVIGGAQVRAALDGADVVLAVGCRLSSWLWGANGPGLGAALIQVDVDAGQIGRAAPAAVAIQADAGLALTALMGAMCRTEPGWAEGLAAARRTHLAGLIGLGTPGPEMAGPGLHPGALAQALGAALPPDALVVLDGGHVSFWHNDLVPARAPRRVFHDPGQAQLGFGLPFALALKRARPGLPVVLATGDGSFGFTIAELDTARRLGLAVVIVVHNNAAWGVIAAGQAKAGFTLGVGLEGTDYAAIARGFGVRGVVVESIDGFRTALDEALTAAETTVLDCRVLWAAHPMLPEFGRTTSAPAAEAALPW